MKTVQQYLSEAFKEEDNKTSDKISKFSIDELVDGYLERDTTVINIMENEKELTAYELLMAMRMRIRQFIEKLSTIEIETTYTPSILYAYENVEDGIKSYFGLVHIEDLKKIGTEANNYAYEFCLHGEIAGFFISEDAYTQMHLVDLLVDVLYEASFFGFEQEDLAGTKKKLDDAMEEIESGSYKSIPAEDVFMGLGIEGEKETEEEKKLKYAYYDAVINYNDYMLKKALKGVIALHIQPTK